MSSSSSLPKSIVFLVHKINHHGSSICRLASVRKEFQYGIDACKKLGNNGSVFREELHFTTSTSSVTSTLNAFRTFTSAPIYQSASSTSSESGDNDIPNGGNTTENKDNANSEYDPKNDSFFTQENAFGSKENKGVGEPNRPVFVPEEEDITTSSDVDDLAAPTNCCMSGCPNCVWIDYVDKLSKRYSDPSLGRERILKELEVIDDENIKAYIMMELRIKKLI